MFRHVSLEVSLRKYTSPSRLPAVEAAAAAEELFRRPTFAIKDTQLEKLWNRLQVRG